MPLFVCDKCDGIDNTACGGTWHTRNMDIWPEEVQGKALCAECTPANFKGGEANDRGGKWHGRFEKRTMTPEKAASNDSAHYVYLGRFEQYRGRRWADYATKNG